ncbi:MAG: DUF2231 domain-containing protein [Flavisolibacter sp.]|jgi:uncharacterized membrane protein
MKIAGHPLHPLMVHFPTALFPMNLVLGILAYTSGNPVFSQAAFFCLAGGAGMGILTAVTGLLDLFHISKSNKKAVATVIYHAGINVPVILIYVVLAYKEWKLYPDIPVPLAGNLVFKGVLVLILFIGNYFGGQLIYKFHAGINMNNERNQI